MLNQNTLPDFTLDNPDINPREVYEILLSFVSKYGESALSEKNRLLYLDLEEVFSPEESMRNLDPLET